MNPYRTLALTLIAAAVLAACSTAPSNTPLLEQVRADYRAAENDPQTRDLAGGDLKLAGDAVARANDAATRGDKPADVDHLAYLAKQRVAIAQETAKQKAAETAVTDADKARDKVRLAARTNEADTAKQNAAASKMESEEAKRQADAAKLQAEAAQRDASESQARAAALETQLKDMDAKKTERGMVITIGDVLFDTDKAQLKAGAAHNVDKLVAFLKQYPQRTVMIEGFTDSVGSDSHNQELSGRRAGAVRTALVNMGIDGSRIAAKGYGETSPVADNDSASGRQLNRRVEIVLSDESGSITPR